MCSVIGKTAHSYCQILWTHSRPGGLAFASLGTLRSAQTSNNIMTARREMLSKDKKRRGFQKGADSESVFIPCPNGIMKDAFASGGLAFASLGKRAPARICSFLTARRAIYKKKKPSHKMQESNERLQMTARRAIHKK